MSEIITFLRALLSRTDRNTTITHVSRGYTCRLTCPVGKSIFMYFFFRPKHVSREIQTIERPYIWLRKRQRVPEKKKQPHWFRLRRRARCPSRILTAGTPSIFCTHALAHTLYLHVYKDLQKKPNREDAYYYIMWAYIFRMNRVEDG